MWRKKNKKKLSLNYFIIKNLIKIYIIALELILVLIIFIIKIIKDYNHINNYKTNNQNNTNKIERKKIGVIGLVHHKNLGNCLLKFAMSTLLKELGFDPYMVGEKMPGNDISFIQNKTNIRIVKSFDEIDKNDYDILMVSSDQTWRPWSSEYYNVAFLKFAKDWDIPKFVYGASIGKDNWFFTNETNEIGKNLLKNFTGISIREVGTIKYVKQYLDLNATFVLDPTMLIDKKYYLDIIDNYQEKKKFEIKNNCILVYKVKMMDNMESFIRKAKNELGYEFISIRLFDIEYIEKFLYVLNNCKAVITNSYHATLFSIIFNKPFIAFYSKELGSERFFTIRDIYGIKDRFFDINENPNLNLLNTPLIMNYTSIEYYRNISLNYLKKNLNII